MVSTIKWGEGIPILLLLLLCPACDPGPLEISGLRCDDGRPCGAGYICANEVCYREGEVPEEDAGVEEDAGTEVDAGIPRAVNLLPNANFEQAFSDAGVPGWRATTGRLLSAPDAGRTGRAGRFQSTGFQQLPVLTPSNDLAGPELGMLFCASLWLRSDADAGTDFTLAIRDRFFDGGTSTSSGTRVTVRNNWVQLKEEFATIGLSTIQLRLSANTRLDAGDGIYVDDAWLSRAGTTGCP